MGISVQWFDVKSNPMCVVLRICRLTLKTYCDEHGLSYHKIMPHQTSISSPNNFSSPSQENETPPPTYEEIKF